MFFSRAGAVPDGGRHALRSHAAAARRRGDGALPGAARRCCVPVDAWRGGARVLRSACSGALERARTRRAPSWRGSPSAPTQAEQLQQENTRLRELLDLRARLQVRVAGGARCCTRRADPYSRKVIIDRGSTQGIAAGSPVIDESGVLGQVTRVYPLSAEVTLLTDKRRRPSRCSTRAPGAQRGLRRPPRRRRRWSCASWPPTPTCRSATCSPPRASTASIRRACRWPRSRASSARADAGFARILLHAAGAVDGVRHVLVLEPLGVQLPPRPEPRRRAPAPKKGRAKEAARDAPMIMPRAARSSCCCRPTRCSSGSRLAAGAARSNMLPLGRIAVRCPTCWRWCSSSGTCTSRCASASAPPSSSAC